MPISSPSTGNHYLHNKFLRDFRLHYNGICISGLVQATTTSGIQVDFCLVIDPSPLPGGDVHSWDGGYLELLVVARAVSLHTLLAL